jgi:CubicO group peptidase (beta-lactamase class C family)
LAPAGLMLRARDLLKFAAMMVDGGRWRGVQVVPQSWVVESLKPIGPATWRIEPVSEVGYGFLWFTGRLHGHQVAWAWGYGAQLSLLVPDLGLAVATAATSPSPSELVKHNNDVMTLVGRMVEAAA